MGVEYLHVYIRIYIEDNIIYVYTVYLSAAQRSSKRGVVLLTRSICVHGNYGGRLITGTDLTNLGFDEICRPYLS